MFNPFKGKNAYQEFLQKINAEEHSNLGEFWARCEQENLICAKEIEGVEL